MIEEVFENLVDQFSDPFTFYRELIQNAMDAGSNQVEVGCEYDEKLERVTVTVADSGEGMSEKVIEEQLTRLFSSTKEHDLTKIGKFGIGFVSIFAIQPECVVLDTGRDGNFWRVVFPGTTQYLLYRLKYPVEGTQIRLFKRLPAVAWPEFLRRSEETISYWCGYSETQVSFNGQLLNKELAVDSPCSVMVTGPGTRAVVGMTADPLPLFGMYNHGLTLKQGEEALLPGLTFRIKSNYLEHTLTRDNVIVDANYHKAMAILNQAAENQLVESFFTRVTALQRNLPEGLDELEELMVAAQAWLKARPKLVKKLLTRPMLATHHHGLISLSQLKSKGFLEGAIYYDTVSGPVTEALAREDIPVLRGHSATELVGLVCNRPFYQANQAVACPQSLDKSQLPPGWKQVEESMREYLRLGEHRLSGVHLADFDYSGSCVQGLACLAESKAGQATRLFQRGIWRNLTIYPGRLLLNVRHSLVVQALQKYESFPEICAYALSKAALLQDGLPQDLEAKMLKRCWSSV
ncbi:MAG: ATP-binding protein [Vulcanimicrobiota bacterium]